MATLDVETVISELTTGEKVTLTAGADFWHTTAVPRLGIPALRTSDGPNGVRGTRFFNGVPAACFPCATGLGATWDAELLHKVGKLLGEECKAKGAHILLGPTINIQRSPLGGRGFESYSEDGVLSGILAGHYCAGMIEENIIPTPKHFVCNDQEHERMGVDSIVTQRALREIYLKPFQIALKMSQPGAIMTAYNKINGTHASENKWIIEDILRKEWKWNGLLISDWFGVYSTSDSINAGLDLEMPGPTRWRGSALQHATACNKVAPHVLDERVRNLLNLVNLASKSGIPENAEEKELNRPQDQALLRCAAAQSIVLMKNENNILPFDKNKSIAVIGPNAKITTYCGGGSATVRPYYLVSPFEGVSAKCAAEVSFAQGVYGHKVLPPLGPLLKTADGNPGYRFRAYNDPPGVEGREIADELHLVNSAALLADYRSPYIKSRTFYIDMEGTFTPNESGTYDFSVTVIGSGKLFIDGELVVDNSKNQKLGTAFFGMATVEVFGSKELNAGQPYQVLFQFGSAPTGDVASGNPDLFGPGAFRFSGCKRLDREKSIAQAVELASKHDQVVIFAGLNNDWESEGHDRESMDLPPGSDELIARVLAANPKTAVVIQSGTPVTMPWEDDTQALLQAWYGGNETGNGIADVLFGDVNPSGKLPLSFPIRLQDNPSYLNFRSERGRVLYGEDVYVGYRYYDKTQTPVLFPFGHGLSYTTFKRSGLQIASEGETLTVSLTVTNSGDRAGSEVVQLYVTPSPTNSIGRPPRELKGFKKIHLEPDQSANVKIEVCRKEATSFWDEIRNAWISEKGVYGVLVEGTATSGKDEDTVLNGIFEVTETVYWNGL
ncbi:beta-glucosidase I [[Emmonsia] crescens]|uniref:beta-glucosidase n=1 Tax=[Emmonsia] crescens TaxID=73230 RepID=A0A0G2I253_9EURO|nr:beta-glucosidase I [Emmonsia crescens UAMH 3008]